jgi:putative ABC transport system ATP-binding protein
MVYCDGHVDTRRALAALSRVGVANRAHHYASELSGGEQQRVAIARALINSPLLILADEPTGNLDFKAGQDVMSLLQELHDDGRTILLVTHDDAVAGYASRELRLQEGKILSSEAVSGTSPRPAIGGRP